MDAFVTLPLLAVASDERSIVTDEALAGPLRHAIAGFAAAIRSSQIAAP